MDFISSEFRDPSKLHGKYVNNDPFPHIVLDNFVNSEILDRVAEEFPDLRALDGKIEFRNEKEVKLASVGSMDLSPAARDLVSYLNSDLFLDYLQQMTGIKEPLISDPYLSGGGYHEIKRGGMLKVHADFNKHPKLDLDRRLNLLLYLNKNWEQSWGGNLELYNKDDLSTPVVSVQPLFNRCVVFTTTSFTFHGHPDALACPEDRSRRSLALYYFSTGRPATEVDQEKHSTLFVPTKGETFSSPPKGLIADWMPPIVLRGVKKLLGR